MLRIIRMFIYLVYIACMLYVSYFIATNWSRRAFAFVMIVLGILYLRGAMNYEEKLIKEGKDTPDLIVKWIRKKKFRK